MTKTQKLPNVEVVIPQFKLSLADLAYLRGLVPGNVSCSCPSSKTRDKLLFLGLIFEATIPPSAKDVFNFESRQKDSLDKISAAFKLKDWQSVSTLSHNLRFPREPKPTKEFQLTDGGVKLLSVGHAKTAISKTGCA